MTHFRRNLIPCVLVLIHALCVLFVYTMVATASDPEAGMAWGFFIGADWPLFEVLKPVYTVLETTISNQELSIAAYILLIGTPYWLLIGLLLQTLLRRYCNVCRKGV